MSTTRYLATAARRYRGLWTTAGMARVRGTRFSHVKVAMNTRSRRGVIGVRRANVFEIARESYLTRRRLLHGDGRAIIALSP
jgi:hypothetical protein